MNLQERINNVVLPSLVVKCDLWDEKLEKYGIYPNAEDSFIISGEFVERSLSKISNTEEREISLGSKLIGSYRDKGSVTGIVDGIYKLQCDFLLQDDIEVTNFCNFLNCLNKKYTINGTTVTFEPDIISGTSTSRDNVNALLIDGLIELDCIIDNTEITMTTEELKDIKIEDLASVRQRDFRLYIVDTSTNVTNIVEELGTHLVIFENYFWQPNHDNSTYISKKYINCLYHQAVDGFQIYAPNLYNSIKRSVNKQSVLEDMLCIGLDFKYDKTLETINQDDILDNLIID